MTHGRIRLGVVLRLIGMDGCLDFQCSTSRLDFLQHFRMALRIHAVVVPQQGEADLLVIVDSLFFFIKPSPDFLLFPEQPIGQNPVLGQGGESRGHCGKGGRKDRFVGRKG